MVANRILRRFGEDNPGTEGLLLLANILIAGFEPFQNAPEEVRREASRSTAWNYHNTLPALEIAILTESKLFLGSTHCQKVIDAIYIGQVVYTPSSFLDMIPDRYKQKPITLYNPRDGPLLNQYRLMVPRTRNTLEIFQFVILLFLYLLFMLERNPEHYGVYEIAFSIFAFGWVLDQFATILAHGWHVYAQNLWSFLDVIFAIVYWAYLILRIHGWRTNDLVPGQQALDVLAMGAPVLVPRLAFNLLSDNIVFLCLRSMMADFMLLTALSACTIVTNATAEIAFRRAVLTLEGVKGDAIFAYQPPFNIIALFVLVPMRFIVSARWFHKIHVATVRAINLPILLLIALLERRLLWPNANHAHDSTEPLPKKRRSIGRFWEMWKITTHGDIQTVFQIAPPESVVEDIAVDDELTRHMIRRQFGRQQSSTVVSTSRKGNNEESNDISVPKVPSRRDSMAPWGDLSQQVRDIIDETIGLEDLAARIERLERSTARVETLLARVCDDAVEDKLPGEELGGSQKASEAHTHVRATESQRRPPENSVLKKEGKRKGMCTTTHYISRACGHHWLQIARPCCPGQGFNTCGVFGDGCARDPAPEVAVDWVCPACRCACVAAPALPFGYYGPGYRVCSCGYDRHYTRMIMDIREGLRWGAGPCRSDPGLECVVM
ncbi:hypothetical protein DL766_002832 [Monosporascus sp. MC13-8B]|uniref:Calcium channel YVC1-like C-terminal transmembrane domain-containing protein n=1 Tax=Monosporascus cannonballus TaxID=155416 RepID=A0ABY0H1U9_9PEZI|nr:hypothetical protein DL762_006500 [Monosporascus cannonballus]RYO88197.1 hypothetical protein DL763_006102 [Monosporascus cannonballus]RYP34842.1 hypothetical protein DL766_002832 [Monosporascus sp. MC13-8B]